MTTQRPYLSDTLRQQVAEEAGYRCGYCLTAQKYTGKRLHVEHIIPIAAGGGSELQNLWLACDLCNSYKGSRTHAIDPVTKQTALLFNPRQQNWQTNFSWRYDGLHVVGLTPTGRATVVALQLNNPFLTEARSWWIKAGWHPPTD